MRSTASNNYDNDTPYLNIRQPENGPASDSKEPTALDWYAEGPGRRVGYDNHTAIDWIFEYAKERARQRVLIANTSGISGYLIQIADASQIWLVLIVTGIAAGALAGFIGIASDWLGDLKGGVCGNVSEGGVFYLSKTFCCWGHDELASCTDWSTWSDMMHVSSKAGSWIIEYIVFIMFSVSTLKIAADFADIPRFYLLHVQQSWSESILSMRNTAVFQRSKLFLVAS
jgi:chloride channel 3/4/5